MCGQYMAVAGTFQRISSHSLSSHRLSSHRLSSHGDGAGLDASDSRAVSVDVRRQGFRRVRSASHAGADVVAAVAHGDRRSKTPMVGLTRWQVLRCRRATRSPRHWSTRWVSSRRSSLLHETSCLSSSCVMLRLPMALLAATALVAMTAMLALMATVEPPLSSRPAATRVTIMNLSTTAASVVECTPVTRQQPMPMTVSPVVCAHGMQRMRLAPQETSVTVPASHLCGLQSSYLHLMMLAVARSLPYM